MSKLYIRGFGDDIDSAQLHRHFGKKKIEKIDLIEKKDDQGNIISRFCYLFTHLPEQAQVKRTNPPNGSMGRHGGVRK